MNKGNLKDERKQENDKRKKLFPINIRGDLKFMELVFHFHEF